MEPRSPIFLRIEAKLCDQTEHGVPYFMVQRYNAYFFTLKRQRNRLKQFFNWNITLKYHEALY